MTIKKITSINNHPNQCIHLENLVSKELSIHNCPNQCIYLDNQYRQESIDIQGQIIALQL